MLNCRDVRKNRLMENTPQYIRLSYLGASEVSQKQKRDLVDSSLSCESQE